MRSSKGTSKTKGRKKGRSPELEASLAQNTADINDALVRALDVIEADRSIPATQEELAERAGCSRGAISYRQDVKKRLKAIKMGRKADAKQMPAPDSPEDLKVRLKEAEDMLKAARNETKVQFDKRLALEQKYEKMRKLHVLQDERVAELRTKLSALGGNPGTVVPFKPPGYASAS